MGVHVALLYRTLEQYYLRATYLGDGGEPQEGQYLLDLCLEGNGKNNRLDEVLDGNGRASFAG